MKIKDPVKVIGLFLPLPILSAIGGLWWWFWFWMFVGVGLGIAELLSYKFKKMSLSEQFWYYDNDIIKTLFVSAWVLFSIYLACHLLWRL